MRILLTGASSFTGCWFARALGAAGHEVVCTMTGDGPGAYPDALRRRRVDAIGRTAAMVSWGCRFGDERFMDLLAKAEIDLLCHHAAEVTDYKSPDFDYTAALASNTRAARPVLEALRESGGRGLVLTGSVFEGGEGAGSDGLPHFSPYGLSKALTAEVLRYECARAGVPLGKFVIPNPFGPLEEPRFTAYLMRSWAAGETPCVRTPSYVRDNIHVSLLADAYAQFVDQIARLEAPGFTRLSPSGYIESQGQFARRVAAAVGPRLGLDCPVEVAEQAEFPEPRVRIGLDPVDMTGKREQEAWDAFAEDYRQRLMTPPKTGAQV